MIDYLEGGWIDHLDHVGPDFRHIHSLQGLTDGLTKVTDRRLAIQVGRINNGRHSLHAIDPVIFSLSGTPAMTEAKVTKRAMPQNHEEARTRVLTSF